MTMRTRKLLTIHKITYKNSCLDRIYLPRSEGGLGLIEVNQCFKSAIVVLGQYLHTSEDPLIVCRYIHWTICNAIGMETKPVWDHEPARSTAHKDFIIYYDKPIPLGRYVEGGAIKPDIVLWARQSKTAQIIEVSVPNEYGLNRAEREKNNKYQDLKMT